MKGRRAVSRFVAVALVASAIAADVARADPPVASSPVPEVVDAGGQRVLQALYAWYGLDPAAPRVRPWVPFLTALSRNPLMRRMVDDAAAGAPPSGAAVGFVQAGASDAVIQIVADGLRRVDDADVIAARPLISKMLAGQLSGCLETGDDGVQRRRNVQVEDELAGLEPVLTRAVIAIDERVPAVAIDVVGLAAAQRRASLLQPLGADRDVPECDRDAAALAARLRGPVADAPTIVRSLLRAYVDTIAQPHVYRPGDAPKYPREALRASIAGSQVVRFTIDPQGHLDTVRFVTSRFAPATVTRPDGTTVPSSELFDAEVRAWLAATSESTPDRFPARAKDGVAAATTYELPFTWIVDAGRREAR